MGVSVQGFSKQDAAEILNFVKENLIDVAKDEINEEVRLGFDKRYVTLVDKRIQQLNKAQAFSVIEFRERANFAEILKGIFERIQSISPRLTGRYKKSTVLLYNKKEVAYSLAGIDAFLRTSKLDVGSRFTFVNKAPYARKLERYSVASGQARKLKRNKKTQALSVNGVFFKTARLFSNRYRGNVSIFYQNISGAQIGLTQYRYKKKRAGQIYLYPSIVVLFNSRGVV